MQSRKLLLVGASLGALINIGMAEAAQAPQSSDSNPAAKPSHKAKPSAKSSADDSPKEMTAQLQALRGNGQSSRALNPTMLGL
jgi:hypothetical protein